MKKILIGLSGGVDSAVSAYLLKKQGYDVTAGFMINYLAPSGEHCPTLEDIEEAKKVASYLEIPFFTFDYREEYEKKVLDYMYEGYKKGITPNPDIICNSEVKFKLFLEEALALGFDKVATGHYARVVESKGCHSELVSESVKEKKSNLEKDPKINSGGQYKEIYHLLKGVDENKDQSYFLAGLSQFQLSKSIFPIGELKKSEVREIAKKIGLPNAARKDSQGICFVGKVKMADFLEKKIKPKSGLVKDISGNVLGEHKGVYYYTIGQRKGLDIGGQKEAIFVIKKDIEKNEIIVGTAKEIELYNDKLKMSNINFLNSEYKDYFSENKGQVTLKAKCKIRYRQVDQDCEILKLEDDLFEVSFKQKQRAIASGQICAVYLKDELIMSGVIK